MCFQSESTSVNQNVSLLKTANSAACKISQIHIFWCNILIAMPFSALKNSLLIPAFQSVLQLLQLLLYQSQPFLQGDQKGGQT